tara:strand:+ start:254 stop:1243 length:990 start_codon:yes stop_codon:yes gene_type:complete
MPNVIDLSQIPRPDIVETIDYEVILAERKADLVALYPADQQAAVAAALERESDPRTKQLQESAYRETVLRQRVNEAGTATMLAYAQGKDLDARAADYNVQRLVVQAADYTVDPPVPQIMEDDDALRRRCLLSLEGLSVAGPEGAYIYHALSAAGRVLDASAKSPKFQWVRRDANGDIVLRCLDDAGLAEPVPGDVVVTILSRDNNGIASQDLLDAVELALSDETVRPLADRVIVKPAELIEFRVVATLYVYEGPDAQVIVDTAQAAIEKYTAGQHRLGLDVTLSGIYAALHQPGVQRVELDLPGETYTISRQQAPRCIGIDIIFGGVDE